MNKEIKTDHFKTLEDLLENCKKWINEEDCYAYWRYFEMQCMEEMYKYIVELQQENEKLNHYKLLYQKVKDRNDKAIELLKEKVKVIPFDENGEGGGLELTDYDIQDLLDILKESGE